RDQHDTATLKLLAMGKPVFTVEFDEGGAATVASAGRVEDWTAEEKQFIEQNEIEPVSTTGCGHLLKMMNFPRLYSLTRDAVVKLYRYIQEQTIASKA
ncbi:hypothetical protein KC921_05090, partial [Candidatus Woesebacteria bacterium]|nr:hypothetical protein [Candidatus Woesebacteria bacterium]